jgi:hypothetical protein
MEVRHMANKKNSAPADEDKVRTAVRRTLKWGLPLTPDDAIEKVREGEQLRAELISSVFFTALASKPAEPKLSDWGAMAFVYQALANADAVDHSVRAGNNEEAQYHDYILRMLCAHQLERALPPSGWRDYVLRVLRRPAPPSQKTLRRGGIEIRNRAIGYAAFMAVGLGLNLTRNPARRDKDGPHSACSLVAEELKSVGIHLGEDAVGKICDALAKENPKATRSLIDGCAAASEKILAGFPTEDNAKPFPSEK